ncbi:MAG: GDP-mannose 4,6-dehydratase [Candidatus Binatia bacterium]|nr:MAG: GDP-mannose 4,6-dehydratase [Candidatus Binatia bacterium]
MLFFVTGIGGFVGGHLARFLVEQGHRVTGLVRKPRFPETLEPIRASVVEPLAVGDVRDERVLLEALERHRPRGVFHLAAESSVRRGEEDPVGVFEVNALGTLRVLLSARSLGAECRVLVVSSAEVYGRPDRLEPLDERCPLRPVTLYGASKAAGEILAAQAADGYGLDVVRARPFNHTGPGQPSRFVCSDLARQVAEIEEGRRQVLEVGNVEIVRDFLDVRDAVSAYWKIWERGTRGAVYNVCSGTGRRISDVLADLRTLAGLSFESRSTTERIREVDVPWLVGDNAALRSLGWSPTVPWERTLHELLAEWRGRVRSIA